MKTEITIYLIHQKDKTAHSVYRNPARISHSICKLAFFPLFSFRFILFIYFDCDFDSLLGFIRELCECELIYRCYLWVCCCVPQHILNWNKSRKQTSIKTKSQRDSECIHIHCCSFVRCYCYGWYCHHRRRRCCYSHFNKIWFFWVFLRFFSKKSANLFETIFNQCFNKLQMKSWI